MKKQNFVQVLAHFSAAPGGQVSPLRPVPGAAQPVAEVRTGPWHGSIRRGAAGCIWALVLMAGLLAGFGQTVDTVLTNRLSEPYTVAVEAGVYYITDSANDRIVRFVPDSGEFTTLAGFAGRPGSADGKGVFARFYNPRGLVAVPDRAGLVVADYANHTLRLVSLVEPVGTVTTIAGTAGQPGFDATHLNFPSALAVDASGNIFIADSKNNAIRKLDPTGALTTVISGLNEPSGVAIGENGDLWISDSRDHTVKRLRPNGTIEIAGGSRGLSGAVDSIFGDESLFNYPTGLLWLGGPNGLLVCDTGNHALRRIYTDPEIGGYSVDTFAGSLTQPGFVNGALRQAKFNTPVGLTKDPTGGFLVADLGNSSIRRIQTSAPQPPVRDPVIGYVIFQKDAFGELLSVLVPVAAAVFNNDAIIAIRAEPATETYYTRGPTPPSDLEDTIPSPNRISGESPPPYRDGLSPGQVWPSIVAPQPDVTIKAIGTQDGRRPSAVVQARFQFKVANPAILGDNPASFLVTNITANAEMWYTTDGSEPSTNGLTSISFDNNFRGLPRSTTPTVFKIRAFRTGYKPSEIVSKTFLPEDFQANRISFGFETGEASSSFVAAAGQTFFAPVTLSLLPNQSMYSLQFNLTVSSASGPAVEPGKIGFKSMLQWNIEKDLYLTIPPAMFLNGMPVPPDVEHPLGFGDLQVTNTTENLLAVGWLERRGATNLYDTIKQDLITYSIAHDNVFLSKNQKVVVGGFAFTVPKDASPASTYQIKIGRPSATSDGVNQDNYIEAPITGVLSSAKTVSVGNPKYLVGDVAPFRWFNAGDFGEGYLLNNDVLQVYQSAAYGLNQPPKGSDFFDAMDSSDGVNNATNLNNVVFGDDTSINNIEQGDGFLNVDDVYVTFRRSLDPSLTWIERYWEGGERRARKLPAQNERPSSSPNLPGELFTAPAILPPESFIPGAPAVLFSAGDILASPGQTLEIPIRSTVIGDYPLRVLMLNLNVEPLEGAPALEEAVQFTPAAGLGAPALNTSRGADNFAAAWLNNKVPGVAGAAVLGTLKVVVPPSATSSAAYRVRFEHASASPNGLGLFPRQSEDGLLLLGNRSGSSVGDGLPDTWRLRYFGSATSVLAHAAADPDSDGVPNWAEFQAGTNPVDARSHLRLSAHRAGHGLRPLTLRWPSTANKSYRVESAPSLLNPDWSIVTDAIIGTGQELQFTPASFGASNVFFRVRMAE